MSAVRNRPASADDLPAAADVFHASVADMYARHGIAQAPPPREVVLANFAHVLSTGFFHVAEIDGRIDGIASAVVRGDLWFLSTFWVRPGGQRRGVGGPLLDAAWRDGVRVGAKTFFTYSSIDATAMASYMKRGMLPGWPILTFAGRPQSVGTEPDPFSTLAGYDVEPLTVAAAAAIDRDVRGAGREVDHAWWLRDGSPFRGTLLRRGGDVAGYFYVVPGYVGPAAWTDEIHAIALISAAFRDAAALAPEFRVIVPGVNHAAVRFALSSGLRLAGFSHFLTTAPFGRLERYLASGPSLF